MEGSQSKNHEEPIHRHGQSMRQMMYHKARDMLRKAKLPKNGSCETVLERWYTDADYQKSLSDEGWTEEKSDTTTQLPWRTSPTKLRLKKGDDGKRTGKLFLTKKEYKVR